MTNIKEILDRHPIQTDNKEYAPTSIGTLEVVFNKLGNVNGKRLLDIGTGDLRVSLVAASKGMTCDAIEKDDAIREVARDVLNDAKNPNITLLSEKDAMDLDWTYDIVFFAYVEPDEAKDKRKYRKVISEKISKMNGRFVALVTDKHLYSQGNLITDPTHPLFDCELETEEKISDEFGGYNLQVYKKLK